MLDTVVATRFLKRMTSGRNVPILVSCGDREVVAKFSGGECGIGGLVREALAALLAADLGLPVPEPVLVELEEGFVDGLPAEEDAVRAILDRSVQPGFGSTRLPSGFFVIGAGQAIDPKVVDQATEIFAFDALTLNADRRLENPNFQFNGKNFAIYATPPRI